MIMTLTSESAASAESEPNSSQPRRRFSRRSLLRASATAVAALSGCPAWGGSDGRESRPGAADETPPETETPATAGETRTAPNTRNGTATGTSTPTPTATPADPFEQHVYVTDSQLAAVKDKIEAEKDPWYSAYRELLPSAKGALASEMSSVTDDGAPRWDDPHQFGYEESRHDYRTALDMTTAVRDLALAYRFTGENRYAEGCIDRIYHWCLNEETRMKPVAKNVWAGASIALWITIPDLWYGASLLRGHAYWQEKTGSDLEASFEDWVRSFVDSMEEPSYYQYNNIWAWRIQTIASAADYLDDQEMFDRAIELWRAERNWKDYKRRRDGKGALKKELERTDGLEYHVYGIKALTMTAEIARHRGINLYGYNAPTDPGEGSTLKKLYRFMVPYLKAPERWKWGVGNNGISSYERNGFASLYELAYSHWQEPAFREVIELVGRPVHDGRLLGWTTLTHGNLFALEDVRTPTSDE